MTDRKSDRVVSITLSILIHLAIVGALVWGWFNYRQPEPTPQSLAIEGTVVRNSAPPAPEPTPPKPVEQPPPVTPPPPTVDEEAQHKKAEEQRANEAAAEQQRQEKAASEKAASEKAASEKAAAERAVADQAAAQKAEADRKAEEQRKAEDQRKAEAARQKVEAEKKAQELAQQKRAEEERAQREADLRSQLAAEEHLNAVQSSPAKSEYLSLITARINRAWIRPPSARSGVKCSVHITQVPGGVITHVTVAGCNGDESVRQSVETAAYRASPLPAPSDPALFDPNIDVTFAPDD
jgi:colicin import membrane protein